MAVSAEYTRIMQEEHHFDTKVSIDGISFGTDKIVNMRVNQAVFDTEPAVGIAACSTIELEVRADVSSFSKMAQILPSFRAVSEKRKSSGVPVTSEWLSYGVYYIDTRKACIHSYGNTVQLTGYDGMLKTSKPLPDSIKFPASAGYVFLSIATAFGLEVETNTRTLASSMTYQIQKKPQYYTGREVLGFICGMYGYSCYMNSGGKLTILDVASALKNAEEG